MPQIINENNWGGRAGGAFGEGLGEGLSYLLQDKLGQMQSARKQAQYSELLQNNGVPASKANLLAYHATSDPGSFHKILGQFGGMPDTQSQQSQQAYQGQQAQRALQQFQHPEATQLAPASSNRTQPAQASQAQETNFLSNLVQGLGGQQQNQQTQQQKSNLGEGVDLLNKSAKNQLLKAAAPELEAEKAAAKVGRELSPSAQEREAQKIARRHHRPSALPDYLNPILGVSPFDQIQAQQAEKQQEQKLVEEKRKAAKAEKEEAEKTERRKKAAEKTQKTLDSQGKLSAKEQSEVNKAETPYIRGLTTEYESNRERKNILNDMKATIEEGGLPIAGYYNLLNNLEKVGESSYILPVGGTIGALAGGSAGALAGPVGSYTGAATGAGLGAGIGTAIAGVINPIVGFLKDVQRKTSPNTQKFEKLSTNLGLKGLKGIFGGNVAVKEMEAYFKSIPTLANNDEGKIAIINSMDSLIEAADTKYYAMREIIKQNNGKIPKNLGLLVNDRVDYELGRLKDDFFNFRSPDEDANLSEPSEEVKTPSTVLKSKSKKKK
jgi:hypothetical protein